MPLHGLPDSGANHDHAPSGKVSEATAYRRARHVVHPGGAGPGRTSAMLPLAPAWLPPVKLKLSVAAAQLWKASVAVPTATVFGGGVVGTSKRRR